MLSREKFLETFAASLQDLTQSEAVVKREVKVLSRSLLAALHGVDSDALLTGDIQFVNQMLPVLSPNNRRVAVLFFVHFTGFHLDEKLGVFTKKSPKRYADARAASVEALTDPNFNLFTWAEREVEIERKPLKLAKVTTYIEGVLKKAAAGMIEGDPTRADILAAIFAGGFTAPEIVACMEAMAAKLKGEEPAPV